MFNTGSQKVGFLLIIIAVIIIGGVTYFVFFYNFKNKPKPLKPAVVETEQTTTPNGQTTTTKTEIKKIERSKLIQSPEQLSASFLERFGTYSNQAPNNFTELKLFMTNDFADWVAKHNNVNNDYKNYDGITTVVVSQKIEEQKEDYVKILAHTTRTQTKLDKVKSFNQDAEIEIIKDGNRWKVNAVYWKK